MKGIACFALLAGGLAACGPARSTLPPSPSAEIPAKFDHVIVAIDTLARGIALLRDLTGVTPRLAGAHFGRGSGAHPGRGMQSAILGLGPGRYLLLVAPDPHDTMGARLVGTFATDLTLTPIGWAVRTSDVDSVRAALLARGLPAAPVRNYELRRPDGATLRWRALMPWEGLTTVPPFFIEWDPSSPYLAEDDAPAGCTLAGLTLAFPQSDSLRAQLDRAGVRVSVSRAARQAIDLTLDCPAGRVRLPGAAPQ